MRDSGQDKASSPITSALYMSLSSFIKKQFIDVIQWPDQNDSTLMWRFPMQDQEIQYGGSLTVRESQAALFVNEGKASDTFQPGMYKLTTNTLPVFTYLKNWDKLFESPFKSDVYFFSIKQVLGRRWGTPQPISVRDKDFGMVRMRAFGLYSYHIADVKTFFTSVAGNRSELLTDHIDEQLDGLVLSNMAAAMGGSGIAFLDMAANQTQMAQTIAQSIRPAFQQIGLELDSFMIQSISLPEELQVALDKRIAMGMAGNLDDYAKFQTANAIPLAAQNAGGIAGTAASMAAGLSIGQMMSQSMIQSPAQAATTPNAAQSPEQRLSTLKGLVEKGLISQADFDLAKAEVLKSLIG
jgi:membrane protease subunit (stomatin/prohibitin family)